MTSALLPAGALSGSVSCGTFDRVAWQALAAQPDSLSRDLISELRSDHAGETGAVMIYRGVLALSRDPAVRAFAQHHLQTEQQHLAELEACIPAAGRSRLLALWRVAGWLTGAVPALFGPRAVYATIDAVETFVDHHYAAQLELIDRLQADRTAPCCPGRHASLAALRELLQRCQLDEVAHRDEARALRQGSPGLFLRVWTAMVASGSVAAVRVCRVV